MPEYKSEDANIEAFVKAGMIDDPDALPEEAKRVLRALNEEEVQQLIEMWKRVGSPEAVGNQQEGAQVEVLFVP